MTSVFYDVIRLESVRGRTNMLIEGHFWRFWGEFEPQNVVGHRVDPQKVLPYVTTRFEPSRVKFHARFTSVGESGKKNKNKKERPYISRISPIAPLRPIGTNFGLRVRLVVTINCAKFFRNRLRGYDSVRVEVWPFPLDCDVAVNTV